MYLTKLRLFLIYYNNFIVLCKCNHLQTKRKTCKSFSKILPYTPPMHVGGVHPLLWGLSKYACIIFTRCMVTRLTRLTRLNQSNTGRAHCNNFSQFSAHMIPQSARIAVLQTLPSNPCIHAFTLDHSSDSASAFVNPYTNNDLKQNLTLVAFSFQCTRRSDTPTILPATIYTQLESPRSIALRF